MPGAPEAHVVMHGEPAGNFRDSNGVIGGRKWFCPPCSVEYGWQSTAQNVSRPHHAGHSLGVFAVAISPQSARVPPCACVSPVRQL